MTNRFYLYFFFCQLQTISFLYMLYRQLCLLWSLLFRNLYIIPYGFSSCLCLFQKIEKVEDIDLRICHSS